MCFFSSAVFSSQKPLYFSVVVTQNNLEFSGFSCKHIWVFSKTSVVTLVTAQTPVGSRLVIGQSATPPCSRNCKNLINNNFTDQQDGVPAHTAEMTQEWISQHCPDMIMRDEWPPNSPDLNPLDYHVWGCNVRETPGVFSDSKEFNGAQERVEGNLDGPAARSYRPCHPSIQKKT